MREFGYFRGILGFLGNFGDFWVFGVLGLWLGVGFWFGDFRGCVGLTF